MATSDISSREARRRRIVERGSDRLALITGRIETLPPPLSESHTPSFPPSVSHLPSHLSDQPTSVTPQSENIAPSSLLPKHDSGTESGQLDNYDGRSRVEPFMRKCETRTEASSTSALELNGRVQSSMVSSMAQNSSISTSTSEHFFETQTHHHKIFTPNQISSAIAASERTRTYCSSAAAILVVLSYIGFPILGSPIVKSIIFSRPLYLVLLTNLSVLLARLLLDKQRGVVRSEPESSSGPSVGGYGLADQVGKALESVLVLQNFIGAVFMDCSVYTIVVICGLSLAHRLGW